MKRAVYKTVRGTASIDGAGVHLVRVFAKAETADFDPFLMLDAFDSSNPDDYTKGFPWHPHRGIETITYLIEGDIEHKDSLGNRESILNGDCQWMTAGSGIIHQEMPQASPRMLGAQLWLNIPAKDKMVDPSYGDITAQNVPVVEENGATIRVLSGKYRDQIGAFEGKYVKATYLDIEMKPGSTFSMNCDKDNTMFAYLFSGSVRLDREDADYVHEKQAALLTLGDTVFFEAGASGARFILLSAPPLRESIAWGGPIVMNTKEELSQAFKDLDDGVFIKHEPDLS